MLTRSLLVLVASSLSACGDVYVLSEEEGVRAARDELLVHGIQADAVGEPLGPIVVDGVAISFVLDGWSAERGLGFEYVAERDPDFDEAPVDLGSLAESQKLEAAVDAALAATPERRVLVLRTWGHETFDLAEEQLRRRVSSWLDGLPPPR